MSVSDLARAVEVSEGAIRKLKNGNSAKPNASNTSALVRVLGVTASYLLYGKDDDSAENEARWRASAEAAFRRQALEIDDLRHRVSTLEDQVDAVLRRIPPE
jgi:transcriptional regulator with XRE-family HTH domain